MAHRIYAHYLDVQRFPDYHRRAVRVPSWETFDDNTQFCSLRVLAQKDGQLTDIERELDLYTIECKLGRVVWALNFCLKADNLSDLVAAIKRRDLYLFDLWGFVPMVNPNIGQWGQIPTPPAALALFQRELGDHFLGIDNGEQDGRYVGTYALQMCPAPLDHRTHYLNFHRHFRRMGDELGNHMSALVSLSAGHYFLKEGNTTLVGAEAAQALPNSQLYYAFLRGAGKQYGVHWFGCTSVFNRWGFKAYGVEPTDQFEPGSHYATGPEEGTSLALLKRLLWTHVLYNSVLFGSESGMILGDNTAKRMSLTRQPPAPPWISPIDYSRGQLTPIGQIQADAQRIVEERGRAGIQLTPLALMLDFYSGWAPPRHLYSRKAYQTWGAIPYSPGDYLMHNVFALLYPGYEDASYYHDERGFLSPTPYGDIADILLSDARDWVLDQYSTVVVAGELRSHPAEVADNLRRYVQRGGRVVLTSGNAALLGTWLTGIRLCADQVHLPAGTRVQVDGQEIIEPHAFDLYQGEMGQGVRVIARCGDLPAAVSHTLGRGEVITMLSPWGLDSEQLTSGPITVEQEQPLPLPFRLCAYVTHLLDGLFADLAPFQVGKGLAYVACRRAPGQYELLVLNNTLEALPFAVQSRLGPITELREASLGADLGGEPGYKPGGYAQADLSQDSDTSIAGLSARLFDVRVAEEQVTELPPVHPAPPVHRRGLDLGNPRSVMEAILLRPTFSYHFDTIQVSWRYLTSHSADYLAEEKEWLDRQKVRRIADFTDGLNYYPDLTLLDNCPGQWERSRAIILSALDGMQVGGYRDAILTLTRRPEAYFTAEQMAESFLRNVRDLCDEAARREITLHMQVHPHRFYATNAEMQAFVRAVDRPNLKYCFAAGHLLSVGTGGSKPDLQATWRDVTADCELVLISAPCTDLAGNVYDAHLPMMGSSYQEELLRLIGQAGNKMLILDVVYPDQDAEYQDARWL